MIFNVPQSGNPAAMDQEIVQNVFLKYPPPKISYFMNPITASYGHRKRVSLHASREDIKFATGGSLAFAS
jgi:hypothetical protein